jgi:hypothetical protein
MSNLPRYSLAADVAMHLRLFHGIWTPTGRMYTMADLVSLIEVHDDEHAGSMAWEAISHEHAAVPEVEPEEEWTWEAPKDTSEWEWQ